MQGLKETDGLTRTEEGDEDEDDEKEGEGKGGERKGKRDPNTFPITLPYTPFVPPTTPPSRVLTEKFTRPIPITRSPVPHSHSHPRPRSATFTRKMPSKLSAVLWCGAVRCGAVWCESQSRITLFLPSHSITSYLSHPVLYPVTFPLF